MLSPREIEETMHDHMLIFIIVGAVAQMVDGALGMAYGVTSTTFLLSVGLTPVAASASVHTAEIFTTAVSGLSHLKFGNVDWRLVKRILFPGVVGGVVGAYVLTTIPGNTIKPFVSGYLVIMGLLIVYKAIKKVRENHVTTHLIPLGLAGGFFDAIGGGGWGPIVTSTLVARGNNPRSSIGSVNFSEFFVTAAQVATFLTVLGVLSHWRIIAGLMIGGVIAAPIAAHFCRKLPSRALMVFVGILITGLSLRTIYLALR